MPTAVQNCSGYNSWPMITAVGDCLVCGYSRGTAHTIGEGERNAFAKMSDDCGKTWGDEIVVADDPSVGEVFGGAGNDSSGAALFWVRCWGELEKRRHELYRTTDGVKFEKIATIRPDPMPMQITDPVLVDGLGLVSPWFAGDYVDDSHNSWGVMVSEDDGCTWEQRKIEDNLAIKDWVTEPSLVNLGMGRLVIIGRCENGSGSLFQITSDDNGRTWRKSRTNIDDVMDSTPSLVFDSKNEQLYLYYYQRGAKLLKRRVVSSLAVFDDPTAWPKPEVLDHGTEESPWDAGNVNVVRKGNMDYCVWYTGTSSNTAIVLTRVPLL